jgi:hypothetical protein
MHLWHFFLTFKVLVVANVGKVDKNIGILKNQIDLFVGAKFLWWTWYQCHKTFFFVNDKLECLPLAIIST